MEKQFGSGVIFVIEHDAIQEDKSVKYPKEVNQLISMGYHYCGNNKMWGEANAWKEMRQTGKGSLLFGMRFETVNEDMADIEIWEKVTYISVQKKNEEKIQKVLQKAPKYKFGN